MNQRFNIWLFLFAFFSFTASQCTSDTAHDHTQTDTPKEISLEDKILEVNKVLLDSKQQIILENAKEYVQLTHQFIKKGKDEKKIIQFANQGAQVATNIKDFKGAVAIYDDLATHFADNPRIVANALFAKAFVLENNLKDIEAAKIIYLKIQKEYPNQEIAKSIPATLDNLGKSEAELLEMLKKQGK